MNLIKSPLNYIGGKYKLLPQILPHFPPDINTFVDLFCGGCDVSLNVQARRIIANDINPHIAEIFNEFKRVGIEWALQFIDNRIAGMHLSDKDKESYVEFRNEYNAGAQRPLDLFVLLAFCFNNQMRFSSKDKFNSAVGKRGFNPVMRKNLIETCYRLDDIEFVTKDFRAFDYQSLTMLDFVYLDPPYTGTCGVYNDGRRGACSWDIENDISLTEIIDDLTLRGIKVALSNIQTEFWIEWAKRCGHKVHLLNKDYGNCNYQRKPKKTQEVLITNF